MTMVLLAMIPKLAVRVLLHVLLLITAFCQKDKGSAGADPRNNKGGSARFTMVLLALIAKLVERVLLHVFHPLKGFCHKNQGSASHVTQISKEGSAACIASIKGGQKNKGSASYAPQVSREGSADCIVFHEGVLPETQRFCLSWSQKL